MSELQIGKFQIVGPLGSGAHSKILHIRRSADGKNYALKVVPISKPEEQKYLEQAQHEFRVAQKLDHPALVKVYALEKVKDWMFRVRKRICSSSTSTARRWTPAPRWHCRF